MHAPGVVQKIAVGRLIAQLQYPLPGSLFSLWSDWRIVYRDEAAAGYTLVRTGKATTIPWYVVNACFLVVQI
jgi:hypothetical protein